MLDTAVGNSDEELPNICWKGVVFAMYLNTRKVEVGGEGTNLTTLARDFWSLSAATESALSRVLHSPCTSDSRWTENRRFTKVEGWYCVTVSSLWWLPCWHDLPHEACHPVRSSEVVHADLMSASFYFLVSCPVLIHSSLNSNAVNKCMDEGSPWDAIAEVSEHVQGALKR